MRFALRHVGLDADKDVQMLSLGINDVMWGALQTGRVAATVLSPPATLFARKAGMNFMVDLTNLKLEYQGSTVATRRSFVHKSPALASRALRAIVRGSIFSRLARKIRCAFSASSWKPTIARRWKNHGRMQPRCRPSPTPWKARSRRCLNI